MSLSPIRRNSRQNSLGEPVYGCSPELPGALRPPKHPFKPKAGAASVCLFLSTPRSLIEYAYLAVSHFDCVTNRNEMKHEAPKPPTKSPCLRRRFPKSPPQTNHSVNALHLMSFRLQIIVIISIFNILGDAIQQSSNFSSSLEKKVGL